VAKEIEQYAITAGEETSNRKSLSVHVYGGSVTVGRGLKNRFSSLLQSMMEVYDHNMTVVVSNFGIGGSGPDYWIQCGIGSADIVISDFRMNVFQNKRSSKKLKA